MFHIRLARLGLFYIVSTCSYGCAAAAFDVQSEPSWPREQHRISTFGIKRDGLMTRAGWQTLGPDTVAPYGAQNCPVAFSEDLFQVVPELAEAIDSYVRLNGVTDPFLQQIAPAAKGDAILFVSIAGRPQMEKDGSRQYEGFRSAPSGRGRHGSGAGAAGGQRGRLREAQQGQSQVARDTFEIAAMLYSISERRSVSLIRMEYGGNSVEEAVRAFNERIAKELPQARCGGWDWNAQVDASAIRALKQE